MSDLLLGKTVTVVPYAVEGWLLGVDLLGEEETAWVAGDTIEPFDLSAVPLAFAVIVVLLGVDWTLRRRSGLA